MTAGIVVIFVGYTASSYGVALLRGYDIPLKNWVDPLHPYQWPAGKVPTIPPGQVFPGGQSAANDGGSTANPPPNALGEWTLGIGSKGWFRALTPAGIYTWIFGESKPKPKK